jgi:hypothetical protein
MNSSLGKSDWTYKNNKQLYVTGGIAISTLILYGVKWVFSKLKKITVNTWLEEYMAEMKEKYTTIKNKKMFPVSFLAHAMNLITEVQNYLYAQDHQDLENERKKNFGNEKLYEELVMETVEVHEKYYFSANSLITEKTGIDMEEIKNQLQTVDQREFKVALMEDKRPYYESELPKIDKIKLKEVYIAYAKTQAQHSRIATEQMILMQKKPEYQEIAFKTIFQNKFLLKDMILIKYGIDTKYLNQLIDKHNLLEDSEIAYYYEEVRRANQFG